ncbi:MAG: permease [Caldilineaceae bacterium]|nr:permease [Caldilineaceae bacterium]
MGSALKEQAQSDIAAPSSAQGRRLRRLLGGGLLLLVLASLIVTSISSPQARFFAAERFQTFVTIFLGLFIEAAPFLLAGSLVSGFIDIFVDRNWVERVIPRHPLLAALTGASMGLAFPVCECGVVPVTRRLYEKGLPPSVGVAFLLAAPVVNPVVIASTWAAFGWGPVLWGRVGLSVLIAFIVGLIFQVAKPREILLADVMEQRVVCSLPNATAQGFTQRVGQALITAGDDFLDMARYLIAGAMMAAAMQTFVSQSMLLTIGQGPVISVFALMALAFVLSVCSTVDAFLALAFSTTFTSGAIVGFLTFGPMVDIKSSLMFLGVFKRRTVAYLILLPFALSAVAAISWNLFLGS